MTDRYLELVCPAGTPAALRAAVDAGADSVYCGFRDSTNARNYPGLNFDPDELRTGVGYAHARGCRVLVAVNTFARAGDPGPWHRAIDAAAASGADAVILADLGALDYAARHHPGLRRHLSVQAAAASALAIRFYQRGVRRQPRGAAARAVGRGCRGAGRKDRHRGRGLRLRQLRHHGRGALLPVLLSHRAFAELRRRLRPGRTRHLSRGGRRADRPPGRGHDEPLRARRARRLSHALQGPLPRPRPAELSVRRAGGAERRAPCWHR